LTRPLGDVSCVVVAYHRPQPLRALAASLVNAGAEVLVVNVEDDPEVASVAIEAGAQHLPVATNVGFAAGVNMGAKSATRPYAVFLNDDLALDAGAVGRTVQVLRDGAADVAVPRVETPEGALEPTVAALPTFARFVLEWCLLPDHAPSWLRWLPVEKWRRPSAREAIDAASAVLVATTRQLLLRHPLPEVYFLYWEESEWFYRLKRAGFRTAYEPAAVVRHAGGRTDVRAEKDVLLTRNALRCLRRTQGRVAAGAAVPAVLVWRLRLVVLAGLLPSQRRLFRSRLAGLRAVPASLPELFRPASRR